MNIRSVNFPHVFSLPVYSNARVLPLSSPLDLFPGTVPLFSGHKPPTLPLLRGLALACISIPPSSFPCWDWGRVCKGEAQLNQGLSGWRLSELEKKKEKGEWNRVPPGATLGKAYLDSIHSRHDEDRASFFLFPLF